MVSAAKKPRQPANRTRNAAMTLKTSKEIRDRLEVLREKSCRSLTQEVEHQIIKALDLEEQIALQDEIKAEMRGTIVALERRIASMEEREDALWPDQATKALGRSFAMTLAAVQQATGQGWRESPTAPAIVANVVRRAMEECGRGGSLFADLFDQDRTAAVTDTIARGVVDGLRAKLPLLPERQPQDDPANWTGMARLAVVFRDKATGEAMEMIRGEEYDVTAPEGRPRLGADYRAALARFEPIRDTIDAEDYIVHKLRDGSTVWDSLTNPGQRTVMRLVGPEEAERLMVPARGQLPPSIGDQAIFDAAMSGLPLVHAEKAGAVTHRKKAPPDDEPQLQPVSAASVPAPKRRAGTKA